VITIPIDPILVSFGHLAIRWYSLIILAAVIVGLFVLLREADRKRFSRDAIFDMIPWLMLGGILGARLFHVIDHWNDTFAANPGRILNIWEGGLAIWGAVAGGLLTLAVLAWRRKWKLAYLLPHWYWDKGLAGWPASLRVTRLENRPPGLLVLPIPVQMQWFQIWEFITPLHPCMNSCSI